MVRIFANKQSPYRPSAMMVDCLLVESTMMASCLDGIGSLPKTNLVKAFDSLLGFVKKTFWRIFLDGFDQSARRISLLAAR